MEIGITLLPFVLMSIVLALANLEGHNPAFRWLAYIALALLNALLVLFGLVGLAVPMLEAPGMAQAALDAYAVFTRAMLLTGLLAFLPFLPPLRKLIARLLPIDPGSAVHTVSLAFAVYLVGLGLGQQPLLSDPAALEGLGGVSVTSGLIWAQALGMILLAITGVGVWIRRSGREALERLGLKRLSLTHLGVAVAAVVGLVVFQVVFSLVWQAVDPAGFQQISDASNLLLGDFTGLAGALTIGLSAAVGEELVFRGALLPRFRLLATSILFTIIHSQYGLSPATVIILAIALVLGILRYRTSLTVCILVHFGYNFVSVLLPSIG